MRKKTFIHLTFILLTASISVANGQAIKKDNIPQVTKNNTANKRNYWPTQDWKTAFPWSKGINPKHLSDMDNFIKGSLSQIRSVVIVKNGYVVFEKYYRHHNSKDLFPIRSITKTFTSALIGIAIKEGYIKNIDQKAIDYFPELLNEYKDSSVNEITIRNLLSMTSGFSWDERILFTPEVQLNMISYAFSRKMTEKPGAVFYYDTLSCQILSAIITRTSGTSELEFADKYLFNPLGIKVRAWDFDSQGYNTGGTGLMLSARDMAKFGYLLLNKGNWAGKQVIPSEWIDTMTRKHVECSASEQDNYGMLCWITTVKDHPAYYACGFGGQFIFVIPDLDTVVVITSNIEAHHIDNKRIIGEFIIPGIKN
jgi:CubicO group peptidase (beta-lactamase class C family)